MKRKDGLKKNSSYDPANIPDDDKIPLTRHVARVQLQAIDCDFKNNYADASFELTHVYIANASNTSLIYADATKPYSWIMLLLILMVVAMSEMTIS